MNKRLIIAGLALLALAAFILPAIASASPEITHPTGTTLATGTKVEATNLESILFTSTAGGVVFECPTATLTGTVVKNNGTEFEINIENSTFSGTAAEGKCTGLGGIRITTTVGNGTPWCLRATNAMNVVEFQIRGGKCSEASRSITFDLHTGLGVTCRYERVNPIRGTFTTHSTGDAILTLTGSGTTGGEDTEFTKEPGDSVLCPANYTLDMKYTFETDGVVQPLYIS